MELWLVRHAVAEDTAPHSTRDFDRPLTATGRQTFQEFARWLLTRTAAPEVIISSPLVRAEQTAKILCDAARRPFHPATALQDWLAPGMRAKDLLHYLRAHPVNSLAAVGHNPDFTHLLRELIGGGQIDFGKGCIACVEFADTPALGEAELRWFLRPKLVISSSEVISPP